MRKPDPADGLESRRGNRVFKFERGGNLFEVFQGGSDDAAYGFVGYFNGKRSVVATSGDIAARALFRKHVIGQPEGKLIDFAVFLRNRKGTEIG
jgi:hypothetical protein